MFIILEIFFFKKYMYFCFCMSNIERPLNIIGLTDTAMLISELTRFDSFYIFSTELLVFLECWPTDKEFRLSWHSFVRVENRLSINKKCKLFESWIFHSEVVRASAWRSRGREFESRTIHFLYQSFYFFISLSFPFYLSQFWSKTMCEYI